MEIRAGLVRASSVGRAGASSHHTHTLPTQPAHGFNVLRSGALDQKYNFEVTLQTVSVWYLKQDSSHLKCHFYVPAYLYVLPMDFALTVFHFLCTKEDNRLS